MGDIICDNTVDIPATRKNVFRADSAFVNCNNKCSGGKKRDCHSSHSYLNVGAFVTNVPGEMGQHIIRHSIFVKLVHGKSGLRVK